MRIVVTLLVTALLAATPAFAVDAGDVPGREGALSGAGWATPDGDASEAGTDAGMPPPPTSAGGAPTAGRADTFDERGDPRKPAGDAGRPPSPAETR